MRFALASLLVTLLMAACQSPDITSTPTPVQWQRVIHASQPAFALNIPGDWHFETADSGIMIFNRPDLLSRQQTDGGLPEGAIGASLSLLSTAEAEAIGAQDAAGVLEAFVGASGAPADLIEIRGRDTAQSIVSIGEDDSLMLAMALGRDYALAIVVAPRGELERQRDLLNQIFDSLELRAGTANG